MKGFVRLNNSWFSAHISDLSEGTADVVVLYSTLAAKHDIVSINMFNLPVYRLHLDSALGLQNKAEKYDSSVEMTSFDPNVSDARLFHRLHPPTSCVVRESGLISASVDEVWNAVKRLDFSWREDIVECTASKIKNETINYSRRTAKFTDGTIQMMCITGLDSYDYKLSWEIIASEPAVSYSSAHFSLSLESVTCSNQTVIFFSTRYSNDANSAVTADQKYKLRDAIKNLQKSFQTET